MNMRKASYALAVFLLAFAADAQTEHGETVSTETGLGPGILRAVGRIDAKPLI